MHKILGVFPQVFVFIASLKSSPVLPPSQPQGGKASQGPAAPWHLEAKGGVDGALDTLASEGHGALGVHVLRARGKSGLHSDKCQSPRHPSPGLGLPSPPQAGTHWLALDSEKPFVSFTVGGVGEQERGTEGDQQGGAKESVSKEAAGGRRQEHWTGSSRV